ncbi:MAG: hypothetical protein DRJ50_12200 [Actinobacteria bacterium]|nr:MAG: hypothetical protein DRJ50_12200 [Actinomycetota bacterium]
MSRIIEYAVITGKDSEDLTIKVNEKLNEGWRPRGNLVVLGDQLLQPIVLREQPGKRIRKTSED